MLVIANIATLNEMKLLDKTRYFTDKTLNQIVKSAVNRPVKLGFHGPPIGNVTKAWIDDNRVFVEFETDFDIRGYNFLVPGLCIASSQKDYFKTVRCHDFALTNQPTDKTLLPIEEIKDDSLYS